MGFDVHTSKNKFLWTQLQDLGQTVDSVANKGRHKNGTKAFVRVYPQLMERFLKHIQYTMYVNILNTYEWAPANLIQRFRFETLFNFSLIVLDYVPSHCLSVGLCT